MLRNQIGKKEIRESIQMVGLDPDSKKHVGKYSLEMRQRLGIRPWLDWDFASRPWLAITKHRKSY